MSHLLLDAGRYKPTAEVINLILTYTYTWINLWGIEHFLAATVDGQTIAPVETQQLQQLVFFTISVGAGLYP